MIAVACFIFFSDFERQQLTNIVYFILVSLNIFLVKNITGIKSSCLTAFSYQLTYDSNDTK